VRFVHLLAFLLLSAATGWATLEGCATNAPTVSYTPITGIEIPSADIVAGHGCGGASGQVFKYAAVVAYQTTADAGPADEAGTTGSALVTSGVFDCFADGIFSNLPADDAGNAKFVISIYAYNACAFPMDLACPPNAASACNAETPSFVAPFVASQPSSWTTTCTATQIPGVTVIAYCPPLEQQGAPAACSDASAE